MSHDPTKIKLGSTGWSGRDVSSFDADPATFKAGIAVRRKADGGLELSDDNSTALAGISLGRDLSNSKRTAVARTGLGVPLRQKQYAATGTFTITDFTNAQGDSAVVAGVAFVGQAGAATPGAATFQSTSNNAAATSLAAQINAHATTSPLVTAQASNNIVTVTAKATGTAGNAITTSWVDASTSGGSAQQATLEGGSNGAAVHGKPVYTNDDGLGCLSTDTDATATNASYDGGLLTGVDEDGSTAWVAKVDMPGGL